MLRKDAFAHVALFTILLVSLRIVFYKDSSGMVLRFAASLYWLFILPGTTLLLAWAKRWGFAERVAAGTAAVLSIVGTASYYLAIMGIHVRYHWVLFTPALLVTGIAAFWLLYPLGAQDDEKEEEKGAAGANTVQEGA